jgi:hypothetical protein
MLKSIFLTLGIVSFSLLAPAQAPANVSSKITGKWLAPACKPRLYGLEDTSGVQVLAPVYEELTAQDNDAWIASYYGKTGVVNSKGEWLVQPVNYPILQYRAGKLIVQKKMLRKTTADEQIITYRDNTDSAIYSGVMDQLGNWLIDPQYSYLAISDDGSLVFGNIYSNYGYLNADGTVLVKAEYDFADFFYDGRAVVSKGGFNSSALNALFLDESIYGKERIDMRANYWGGKWSVLNQSGQTVTKIEYDYIRDYNEGRAAFNKGGIWKSSKRYGASGKLISGRWGFIDKEGNEIIAPIYDYVYDFENGIAKVRLGERIFWIDREGKEVAAPTQFKRANTLSIFCDPGFYGFIDQTGKWSIEPQFIRAGIFSEGLAAVVPMRASDNVCEVATNSNTDYESLDDAYRIRLLRLGVRRSRRYEPAEATFEAPTRRLYGYIDASGKMSIAPKYDLALPFQQGRAYVCFRDKWGIIDKKGNWIVQPILDWPPSMTNGFERNQRRSYMYKAINDNGKMKEPIAENLQYDVPFRRVVNIYQFQEGMGIIYKDGRYGVVDTSGKIIVAPLYNKIRHYQQGLAAVELNERWGFIDKTGKEVIPVSYMSVGDFAKEGLAWARYSKLAADAGDVEQYEADVLYGFINMKGEWVIQPRFVYLSEFSEGLAVASVDYTNKGYIDKTGTFVIPPKYQTAYVFNNGLAWVSMATLDAVYIDKKGKVSKEFIPNKKDPPQQDSPLIWHEDANGRIGYQNNTGDWVIKPEYSIGGMFSKVE